ncbi:MAG: adenylate kinase [Clostridia bacterium]|mgnify:CR=1 FL=1|nr:adenylate kinase [Clostridia bacterium]
MRIIFLGAPGSGKGTQSAILSKKLGIPTISTGDIIRNVLKSGGKQAEVLKSYTENGKLVPDNLVIEILKSRISDSDCSNGYILDGFPRTVAQAEALENMGVKIDIVIDIDVDDNLICKRMLSRLVCSKCGSVFNSATEMRPKIENICDNCGSKLIQRKDDTENTIRTRLKVYKEQTLPLRDYYSSKKILKKIDGSKPIAQSSAEVLNLVKN